MSEHSRSRNSRQNPPENHTSSEANAGESSTLWQNPSVSRKIKNATKKISDSRGRNPILPNVDRAGVSSIPNIKVQDTSSCTEQGTDLQSALRTANEAAKGMNLLSDMAYLDHIPHETHQRTLRLYIISRIHIFNPSGYLTVLSGPSQRCIHTQRWH
ncbi:hypothetical protein BDR07DRAFT_864801 [Suillus spraguei]|nr:hypothetical protein BDR07DRAFT_864801 [Suillus spraguei]